MKIYKLSPVVLLLVFFISTLNQPLKAQNQAGMPDPGFGTNGQVITPSPGNLGTSDLRDFLLQPDGKIVGVGTHIHADMQTSFLRFLLMRYNADGSPDGSFGDNGVSSTGFGGSAVANSAALQADGKILVGGEFMSAAPGLADRNDAILARYNADGTLDNSFGNNGTVIIDLASFEEISKEDIRKLIALPDGKILAVGLKYSRHAAYGDLWTSSTVIFRFNADGTPDGSFGRQGKVVSNILSASEMPGAAVLSDDGKLLVSALVDYKNSQRRFILARYNQDGSLDTSFASSGVLAFDRQDLIQNKFTVLGSGQIYLLVSPDLFLYNANGSLNALLVRQNQMPVTMRNFAVQPDGKVIIAGDFLQPGNYRHGIARFHPNGQIDASFGVNGSFIKPTDFAVNPLKIILQPDGKTLVGGIASPNGHGSFAFYRYLGDGQLTDWNDSKRGKRLAP
jgi:uncharacterized delta-60 repeat protein